MTQVKRKTLLSVLMCVFAIMMALSFVTFTKTSALATGSLLSDVENLTVTMQTDGPNAEMTGIKLSTQEGGVGSVSINDLKGPFNLKYRAYSTEEGACDFDKLTITFTSKIDAFESFYVEITDIKSPYGNVWGSYHVVWHKEIKNEGPLFRPNTNYGETHPKNLDVLKNWESSIRMYNGKFGLIPGISFSPFTKELKFTAGDSVEGLLVDFDDELSMRKNFASLQTVEDFSNYDVTITLDAVAGKVANMMLYSINGESLAGEEILDEKGPIFNSDINLPVGVIGRPYNLDVASYKAFDLVDGLIAFNGEVKLTTPSNEVIDIPDGKFTPEEYGKHTISFYPVDSKGNVGEAVNVTVNVISEYPATDFEIGYEISNDLFINGKVKFPGASFTSPLGGKYDGEIITSAVVKANGQEIKQIADATNPFVVKDLAGYQTVSVIYSATDYLGNTFYSDEFVVNTNNANLDVSTINDIYVIGDYVYVEDVQGATHKVISPTGKTSTFEKILVDEVGMWTVNYSYGEGKVYTQYFVAVETVASLWETKLGLKVLDEIGESASYSRTHRVGSIMNSATPNSKAIYKNIINVSQYTLDDILYEFFTVPKVKGSNEFKQITVYLDDLNDPSRSIRLEHYLTPYFYYEYVATRVYVGDILVDPYVYVGHSTFYGEWRKSGTNASQYNNTPVKVTFDYANKAMDFSNDFENRTVSLCDPNTIGAGNEWKGFTNDELRLTIEFTSLAQEANLMVRTIDNMSLTKYIVTDTSAPKLNVTYDVNNVPKALVGEEFPIMTAYAMDSIDGKITDYEVAVKFLDNGRVFDVELAPDRTFTPSAPGKYKITYTAVDNSGNVGKKDVIINAYNTLDPLSIDLAANLNDYYPTQINLGEKFVKYPAVGVGGSGTVGVEIIIKDAKNDYAVPVDGVYVMPSKATDDLQVIYKLSDYLGQESEFVVHVKVVASPDAVFTDVVLPRAVLANKEFKIPQRQAYVYNADGSKTQLPVGVKVNGIEIEGNSYTPTAEETQFTISYETSKGVDGPYNVKVVALSKGRGYLAKYFDIEGDITVETNPSSTEQRKYLIFNVNSDSSMFFLTPQSALNTIVAFTLENATNNIGKINFTYQSVDNPDEKVVLTVQKDPEPSKTTGLVTVNGRYTYTLPGDVTKLLPAGVTLGFKGNRLVGNNGAIISMITDTVDGQAFNGFTSDKVYLTISFEDVTAPSQFRIISMNTTQKFHIVLTSDTVVPQLVMSSEIELGTYGQVYKLPEMAVEDTLDINVTATMKIESPTGKTIYDGVVVSGYEFLIEEYGTYKIIINTSDSNGNKSHTPIYASIKVLELAKPEILIQGEVQEIARVGERIIVPELLNVPATAKTFIYIITANGDQISPDANGEFVATERGNYKLHYVIMSASGTISAKSFTIKVK